MKILITGTQGLAESLRDAYIDNEVTSISKSNGFDICNVNQWDTISNMLATSSSIWNIQKTLKYLKIHDFTPYNKL